MVVMVMLPFAAAMAFKSTTPVLRICQVLVEVLLVDRITVLNQKHQWVAYSERGERRDFDILVSRFTDGGRSDDKPKSARLFARTRQRGNKTATFTVSTSAIPATI
jgi:hypothetical protein